MPSQALVPAKSKTKNTPGEKDVKTPKSESSAELVESTTKLMDEIDRILAIESVATAAEKLKSDEPKKEYSLADAMRDGATCTDQAISAWTTSVGETCALSAAMLAIRAKGLA